MNFPSDLKYTAHDEWVRVDGDLLVVGVTDYAQDALGALVHVELPEPGSVVASGEVLCEVESVKAVAEVYSPVAGEVIEVNESLDGEEDLVNRDPYGEGWLVKVRVRDTAALDVLMDRDAYRRKVDA